MIVIRSLVPGGVAERDGRLLPGDRLMYVNSSGLESASLEDAVQALKGAKLGPVQIGVAKPLPVGTGRARILPMSFLFAPSERWRQDATGVTAVAAGGPRSALVWNDRIRQRDCPG